MRSLTWLGQAGFALRIDDRLTLIDPWLTDHEVRTRPPLEPSWLTRGVDVVLVTHEHGDHLDSEFIAAVATESRDARVAIPHEATAALAGVTGAGRVIAVAPGSVFEVEGMSVTAVRADHMRSGEPPLAGCVGYLIELTGGPTIYHSGDTLVTAEVVAALQGRTVDIALLPINGRDYFRESRDLVGNMNAREAVEFAQLLGARMLIPTHWDADAGNTERPGAVSDYAWDIDASLHVIVLARGLALPLDGFAAGDRNADRNLQRRA